MATGRSSGCQSEQTQSGEYERKARNLNLTGPAKGACGLIHVMFMNFTKAGGLNVGSRETATCNPAPYTSQKAEVIVL
jgi:hypothetical protein